MRSDEAGIETLLTMKNLMGYVTEEEEEEEEEEVCIDLPDLHSDLWMV